MPLSGRMESERILNLRRRLGEVDRLRVEAIRDLRQGLAEEAGIAEGSHVLADGVQYRVALVDAQVSSGAVWVWGNPEDGKGGFKLRERRLLTEWAKEEQPAYSAFQNCP